jgi:uncharacterized protein DUF4193
MKSPPLGVVRPERLPPSAREYNPPAEKRDRTVEDLEDTLEDEEVDEEGAEPGTPDEDAPTTPAPATTGTGRDEDVESIQDILVKQEARAEEAEEEDDSVLTLTREERLEPLSVKVVPPQPTEFICSNCYLVKHRSQLKDKAKMLCRDCA